MRRANGSNMEFAQSRRLATVSPARRALRTGTSRAASFESGKENAECPSLSGVAGRTS